MSSRFERQKLYKSSRWRRARVAFLAEHPVCKLCLNVGKVTPATVVDHVTPHRGDTVLFWDKSNWQALCEPCHNGAKQRIERRGYDDTVGLDGMPTDPNHPFNR